MIYGEARGESEQGMVAVAYTAVNRAVKKRICQVVLAPKQYSIFNDNPALKAAATSLHIEPIQKNVIDTASWKTSMKIAKDVLKGKVKDPTGGSTHYVAYESLTRIPHWTTVYHKTVVIDNHTFFRRKVDV
jgi:spore germination cell wall hydrolase CwlJ-like protein